MPQRVQGCLIGRLLFRIGGAPAKRTTTDLTFDLNLTRFWPGGHERDIHRNRSLTSIHEAATSHRLKTVVFALCGQCKPLILFHLMQSTRCYDELRRAIGKASDKARSWNGASAAIAATACQCCG